MPSIARAIARGTVRMLSRTSPLGISAASMPANAKIRINDVRAKSAVAGIAAIARFSPRTKNMPAAAIRINGNSLATVAMVLSRTPSVTPRRLITDQNTNAATSSVVVATHPEKPGTSCARLLANTVETAAVANVPSIHSSTPERNPANGPNAVPT